MFSKIEYRRRFLPHQRLRYRICFDEDQVAGDMVICHLSNQFGLPAQWDICTLRWNLSLDEDKKALYRLLNETEEEEGINYNLAYKEAEEFKKYLKAKHRSYFFCPVTIKNEWVNKPVPTHFPISIEEVIKKIADFRKCQG